MDDRKKIVESGYNALASRFAVWASEGGTTDARDRVLAEFIRRTPPGARVLDLGCGSGIPSTRELSKSFDVTGVDASIAQVRLARRNVPTATFMHADFSEAEFPEASFSGVCALYSISHVPRQQHAELFAKVWTWLRPGGLFVAVLGATDSPDWIGEWLGVPMFFSSYDAATNRALLRDAGFHLVLDEVLDTVEPEGPVPFLWVISQKA
ncbi:MAG: class I SAM-dependent methyltransferase [Chloroflexi bacterium]|nr:class I SAM-dependent methyltransferase [Chloroflexota bacterium]